MKFCILTARSGRTVFCQNDYVLLKKEFLYESVLDQKI